MTKQTCEFVESSEIFRDCPLAQQAFLSSDPDFSFGNNNRTLITASRLSWHMDCIFPHSDREEKEMFLVISRLNELGETYVDLEN